MPSIEPNGPESASAGEPEVGPTESVAATVAVVETPVAPAGGACAEIVQQGAPDRVPYAMCFGWDDQPDKGGLITTQILPTLQRAPSEADMAALARRSRQASHPESSLRR